MVKKLIIVVLLAALLLPVAVLAEGQILDRENLFTASEVAEMTKIIEHIESEHQIDLVVLTTDDVPYDSSYEMYRVRDYADDFYDNGGYGMGPDDSGMLILIDMNNRVVWLSTAGVMMEYINDSREEAILDACYDKLHYASYGAGVIDALELTGHYMNKGRAEGTFLYDEVTGQRLSGVHNALTAGEIGLAAIAGVAVAAVFVVSVTASYSLKGSTYRYDRNANTAIILTRDDEQYLRQTVTRTVRHQNNGGGGGSFGGGGGSGVHRSSSGRTHGGGGRRF